MDKRFILALVLTAAVVIATPMLFPDANRAPVGAVSGDSLATDSLAVGTPGAGSAVAGVTTPATTGDTNISGLRAATPSVAAGIADSGMLAAQPAPVVPVETTTVTTPLAAYRFSNSGAALVGTTLERYTSLRDGESDQKVELSRGDAPLLHYRLVVPGDTISLDKVQFQLEQQAGSESDAGPLVYTGAVDGMQVQIAYSFRPDSYRVAVSGSVANAPARSYLLMDMPSGLPSSEADEKDDVNHMGYVYKPLTDNATSILFRKLDPGERSLQTRPMSWVAVKNKYFLVALLSPDSVPFAELQVTGGPRTEKAATVAYGTVVTPLGANGDFAFSIYTGPQEWRRLLAIGRDFQNVNPYGGFMQAAIQPFAQIVMRMLLWMKDTTALNYGWVLVIFGVAVRVIMWPLNQKAMRSQLKTQRIQPELQAAQKKNAGDPAKQQAETLRIYKEHGMSPFSALTGCLPMMLPMPILFALFFVFQNTIEFRGVGFLWLHNIATFDPYYIMPVLTGITSFVMSYIGIRGAPPNPQAKLFAYVMPLTFAVLFARLAAGLHIYYTVQNIAALPQQWMLSKERAKVLPATPPVVEDPKPARSRRQRA